ncbi:hypothetical protein SLEP1_g19420 [Rubroshorea leprosula]|uniref:RING-type E3 ubiquitin transferase n=1 Tax=Rubroshorea leprosula TaxID=152421 RepID=A0AAV5IZ94_9ROSI|nr:hypothetical protein SLEP1_g19420 [Rubroshorea leprosula]
MRNKVVEISTGIMIMGVVIAVILLFLGIGVLVVIHICVARSTLERRFGAAAAAEMRGNRRRRSMSQDDLEKLPSFDYIAGDKGSSPVDCAVCLDNFKIGEKCRLLPLCKHSFHAQCVDSWLLRNPICPICRTRADHGKTGLLAGEESSRFSDTDVINSRQRQSAETRHSSNDTIIGLRDSQITEDGHVRDTGNESREIQIH